MKDFRFVFVSFVCVLGACAPSRSNWVGSEPTVQQAQVVTPPPPPPAPPPSPAPVVKFPTASSDVAAVAFEDRSTSSNDEDFNDFLTDFRIFERINPDNQITDIVIDFYPRAVGAWYDHQFLLALNGTENSPTAKTKTLPALVNGPAKVTLTYYGAHGDQPTAPAIEKPADQDLVVFDSTHLLFTDPSHVREIINTVPGTPYIEAKTRARVSITLQDPSQNQVDPNNPIDLSKFRMMLHVKDTNRYVDIIDVDGTDFDKNKQDGQEYPFGFIIPVDWQWPAEGAPISDAYPSFKAYRSFLQERLTNPAATASDGVMKWYDAAPVAAKTYSQGKALPPPELLPNPW